MAEKKPPAGSNEEEYFRRVESERLERRRQDSASQKNAAEELAARHAAIGRCPKDGSQLHQLTYMKVTLDQCPECKGIWLDHGEGRAILAAEQKAGKGFFTDFIGSLAGTKKEHSPL